MAVYLKLVIRRRVVLLRYSTLYCMSLSSLHCISYCCDVDKLFLMAFSDVQGDDKDFFKFKLGSQEVRQLPLYLVWYDKTLF